MVASKRIDNITEHLTYEIFLYFQRGLFERHKIVFALMLAFAVLTSSGKVMPAALGFDQAVIFGYSCRSISGTGPVLGQQPT